MDTPLETETVYKAIIALDSIVETAFQKDKTVRSQRRLTQADRLKTLSDQNDTLRRGLEDCRIGIQRWAKIVAELYRTVPGVKERIARYLPVDSDHESSSAPVSAGDQSPGLANIGNPSSSHDNG